MTRRDRHLARQPRRLAVFLALVTAAALLVGCDASTTTDGGVASTNANAAAAPVVPIETLVRGATALDDDAHEALKNLFLTALDERAAQHGYRFLTKASDRAPRATIHFDMLPADGGEQEVRFHLELELEARTEPQPGRPGLGNIKLATTSKTERRSGESREDMRARAAREAATALADAFITAARIATADTESLAAILADPSIGEDALLRAIREAGQRRDKRLGPPLRALLVHPSGEVVLAGVTMLGQLRDEGAVGAISELLTSSNPQRFENALRALAAIGGKDAEEALARTARSHPDPRAREAAEQMLFKMMR